MARFEEQLAALEQVVERLERGELSLEDSVRLFEEGITLSNACKAELDAAEGRIQLLVGPETNNVSIQELAIEEDDDLVEDEEDEE